MPCLDARHVNLSACPSLPCMVWCGVKRRNVLRAQVASYNGWEYAVLERELGAHRDPSRKMLVTVNNLNFSMQLVTVFWQSFSIVIPPWKNVRCITRVDRTAVWQRQSGVKFKSEM